MKNVVTVIILQVLPLLASATSPPSIDPKDVTIIEGRRYYFSNIFYVTAPEALQICQSELNMTLAGFETLEEFTAVTDYMTNVLGRTDPYYTSGTRQIDTWIWSNSGTAFSYFKWNVGEPSNLDNTLQVNICVVNGFMHDCWPTYNYRFICEEKPPCSTI